MPKLTADQIQFIDTYLAEVGVEYEDIRYEMTDHVATALEEQDGDFMENFKVYMLQHKQALLDQSKAFGWQAGKRAIRVFMKTLVQPYILFAFTMIFLFLYKLYGFYPAEEVQGWYHITFIIAYFASCYPIMKGRISGKREYSVAFKVINLPGLAVFLFHLIINPLYSRMPLWLALLLQSFCLGYILAMVVARVQLKKRYVRLYLK